jgi:hypothetical protein
MVNNQLRMEELICKSISDKQLLKIHYMGGPERIVEPYVYGRDKYSLKLNAYQISGYSISGNIPEWRLFKVELINHMVKLDQKFTVRKTYNPEYEIVNEVICKVL